MKIIQKIKQMFCTHVYSECIAEEKSMFRVISGERIFIVCDKCGHIKGSYFRKY